MASKNFSILYSSSVSNSSEKSKSKSKSKSKNNTLKSKSKTLKSKSKSKSKRNPIRRNTLRRNPRRTIRRKTPSPINIRKMRKDIQTLLARKNYNNNGRAGIITLYYNDRLVNDVHIHLWANNNKYGYHIKSTFNENTYQLTLGYDRHNSLLYKIKNNLNNVVMSRNSIGRGRIDVIKYLQTKGGVNEINTNKLMDFMMNVLTIVEDVIGSNTQIGGKTRKNKKYKINRTKRNKH